MRGELSGFLNPKLSVGGVFRRVLERAIFALLERKIYAFMTAANAGTRITCRELQTVASTKHEWRLSSTPRAEHKSALSRGPVGSFFAYPHSKRIQESNQIFPAARPTKYSHLWGPLVGPLKHYFRSRTHDLGG